MSRPSLTAALARLAELRGQRDGIAKERREACNEGGLAVALT